MTRCTKMKALQKGKVRYVMAWHETRYGKNEFVEYCNVTLETYYISKPKEEDDVFFGTMSDGTLESPVVKREASKRLADHFYEQLLKRGFKEFRNMAEVSWYATGAAQPPYGEWKEEWEVSGNQLVPIKSEVLNRWF